MFQSIWKFACRVTLILGVLLTFFILLELMRGYVFFHRIHAWAGAGYVITVLAFLLFSVFYILGKWYRIPRVLKAPELPDDVQNASFKELHAYAYYLAEYMQRLMENKLLDEKQISHLKHGITGIADVFSAHPLRDDLIREIDLVENKVIQPVLTDLEVTATEEVRSSVRDIMLGVTLSPYHTIDLLIVLYRNACMVVRIANIFESRPEKYEQFLIIRDTLRVVAAVNILNMGRTLMESLFSNLPLVGRAVDDISQGLGAGLLTSATGHAAILRCAAFRPWSKKKAVDSITGRAREFLLDIRNMFTRDILPQLKTRISLSCGTEQTEEPGFWNTLTQGINTAFDNSISTMDALIIKPAIAGTRSATRMGSTAVRHTSHRRKHSSSSSRGISKILTTFSQRVKYSFRYKNIK